MLNFGQTNIGIYQIIEISDGRRYIMDTSKITPKMYGWGTLPHQVESEMVELKTDNQAFDLENKSATISIWIVLAVQPLIKVGYDIFKQSFKTYNISQQFMAKILLFSLSILLAYGLYRMYLKNCHERANRFLSTDRRKVKLVFQTSGKRNFDYYFLLLKY